MKKAPSLTTIVTRALGTRGECALPRGSRLLVAVSGGPDSMALLSAAARVAPRVDLTIVAHGVDHGLRAEAAAELDLAEAQARDLGVAFDRTQVKVERGGNLQARARDARWRALVRAARVNDVTAIATAHHAEDRAETLLMRLLRGAGLRGLAVLPPKATCAPADAPDLLLLRPLLRATRADVTLHLTRHKIPFAIDPSNADPRFVRVRVRRELLPLLRELDPRVVEHLSAIADEALVGREPEESRALSWMSALPRPTQEALLRDDPKLEVWLPGGWVARRDPGDHSRKTRPRSRSTRAV